MLVATNAHVHATLAEPGEFVLELREIGVTQTRRDGDFETRAAAGAERVFGDGLRRVRREPAGALDVAAGLAARRDDARPDERRAAGGRPRGVAFAREGVRGGPPRGVRATR